MREVIIHNVTCPCPTTSKQRALAVVTHSAELYQAMTEWEDFDPASDPKDGESIQEDLRDNVIWSCADVIQEACNIAAGLGIGNLAPALRLARDRSERRYGNG